MGIRILLADDSVTAQNMGKKILSEAGHEVVTVSNGAAAAKKIAEMKPDLALLDVFMPGYSGLELCEKLRNAAETTRLPVILTVGKMEPYSPQDGARVKADGVIIKPFEASDLTAAVERLAQKLTSIPKSSSNGRKSEKPANYEPTVRLDSKQIAEMLKSGGPESSKPDAATASVEASTAEEFHVSPMTSEAMEAGLPALAEELASAAKAENAPATMNSYMEEYLSDSATVAVEPAPAPLPQASSLAIEDQSSASQISAEIPVSNELSVSRFDSPISSDAPVSAPEGFEPTAAAAVNEMPVAQEPGFEATLHSSEAVTAVVRDPALETDAHQATTAFPTKFGTAEADIYEAPMSNVSQELVAASDATLEAAISGHLDGESQQLARPIDEFEARLQQAMAAYQTESEPTEITDKFSSQHQPPDSELPTTTEAKSTAEGSDSFESRVQAAMQNFEDAGQTAEFSVETQHDASSVEPPSDAMGTAINEASVTDSEEGELSHRVETQHGAPQVETADASEFNEAHIEAIASEAITPSDTETAVATPHAAPETDETVIQQVRDSFSEHSVDGASMPELGSDTQPIPMAMAAAAATMAQPFESPSVSSEREAAFEITRALSYAINAETSPEVAAQPEGTPSAETEARDSNKMAGVVERVLQRELPSLVWKVMAEIDLEKQRR